MNQSRRYFNLAALTSSVVLASSFVSYHAGAFEWLKETNTETDNSGSPKLTFTGSFTSEEDSEAATKDPTVMYGSKAPFRVTLPASARKSEVVTYPGAESTSQVPAPEPKRIMNGTKYAPVFVTPTLQWAVPKNVYLPPEASEEFHRKHKAKEKTSEPPKVKSPSSTQPPPETKRTPSPLLPGSKSGLIQ